MKYRLAIFDSDGTLADTLPWMRRIFSELADEHGFKKVSEDEHERFRDLHGAALLRALDLPLWKVPRVAQSVRQRMAEQIAQFSLYAGISGVLHQLSRHGIHMAIVSSNAEANVKHILGADTALFAHFSCGASLFGKASKLRRILRASGIPAQQGIYIGDEIRDAEAARQVGLAFGAVAWGEHRPETLRAQKPDEFFGRVDEIAEKLISRDNNHASY